MGKDHDDMTDEERDEAFAAIKAELKKIEANPESAAEDARTDKVLTLSARLALINFAYTLEQEEGILKDPEVIAAVNRVRERRERQENRREMKAMKKEWAETIMELLKRVPKDKMERPWLDDLVQLMCWLDPSRLPNGEAHASAG